MYFLFRYFLLPRVTWHLWTALDWGLILDPEGSRQDVCYCAETPCTLARCHIWPLHHLKLMLGGTDPGFWSASPGTTLSTWLCLALLPFHSLAYTLFIPSFLPLLILHPHSCEWRLPGGPTFPSYGDRCHSSQPTRMSSWYSRTLFHLTPI